MHVCIQLVFSLYELFGVFNLLLRTEIYPMMGLEVFSDVAPVDTAHGDNSASLASLILPRCFSHSCCNAASSFRLRLSPFSVRAPPLCV